MNFERGIDPKEALGVGIKANAILLEKIWANFDAGTHDLSPEEILNFLENGYKKNSPLITYHFITKGDPISFTAIFQEKINTWIYYKGKYYYLDFSI